MMLPTPPQLRAFIKESNKIEGLLNRPTGIELNAHRILLGKHQMTVAALKEFVMDIAGAAIRDQPGMNVRVGSYLPPVGGPQIVDSLEDGILRHANVGGQPFLVHRLYESLHPFMDGNGRSGRALWLWMMLREGRDRYVMQRGFLHTWYYQSLAAARG